LSSLRFAPIHPFQSSFRAPTFNGIQQPTAAAATTTTNAAATVAVAAAATTVAVACGSTDLFQATPSSTTLDRIQESATPTCS
jgi:hypothetical protein